MTLCTLNAIHSNDLTGVITLSLDLETAESDPVTATVTVSWDGVWDVVSCEGAREADVLAAVQRDRLVRREIEWAREGLAMAVGE